MGLVLAGWYFFFPQHAKVVPKEYQDWEKVFPSEMGADSVFPQLEYIQEQIIEIIFSFLFLGKFIIPVYYWIYSLLLGGDKAFSIRSQF